MTARPGYRWHLRRVMAERGMFATTEMVPCLAERGISLSREQVYRLVTRVPERLNLTVLAALCDILGCGVADLIEPVTRWVLDEALRQQRIWRDEGLDLTMAVNISARSLHSSSKLPETVAELTKAWDTPPDRLILELTEGALIESGGPVRKCQPAAALARP